MWILFFTLIAFSPCQGRSIRDLNIPYVGSVFDYIDYDERPTQTEVPSTVPTTAKTTTTTTFRPTTTSTTTARTTTQRVTTAMTTTSSTTTSLVTSIRTTAATTSSPTKVTPTSATVVKIFHSAHSKDSVRSTVEENIINNDVVKAVKNLNENVIGVLRDVRNLSQKQTKEINDLRRDVSDAVSRLPLVELNGRGLQALRSEVSDLSKAFSDWMTLNKDSIPLPENQLQDERFVFSFDSFYLESRVDS